MIRSLDSFGKRTNMENKQLNEKELAVREFLKNDSEEEYSKIRQRIVDSRRSVRPGFAEDVYGSSGAPKSKTELSSGLSSECSAIFNVMDSLDDANPSAEMCVSALAQRRSANLPKLKELASVSSEMNASTADPLSSARMNMSELDFKFADTDTHHAEMAEIYSYSEMDEFVVNFETFNKYMKEHKKLSSWIELGTQEKAKILQDLAGRLESADPEIRLETARILLYILQGAYGDFAESDEDGTGEDRDGHGVDCPSGGELSIGSVEFAYGSKSPLNWADRGTGGHEHGCLINAAYSAYLIYEHGLFQPLCTMLQIESQLPFNLEKCAERSSHSRQSSVSNSRSASNMDLADGGSSSGGFERRTRKSATVADNESLRATINCLYSMVEVMRRKELIADVHQRYPGRYSRERMDVLRAQFLIELDEPLDSAKTPLVVLLFDLMPPFIRGTTPHYPIKKILLLCWKLLLCTLGDSNFLREEKARKRRESGLPPVEDTLAIASKIKATNCGISGGQLDTDAVISSLSRMGRKVRSIHPPRTFSRQIAYSSNSTEGNQQQSAVERGQLDQRFSTKTCASNEPFSIGEKNEFSNVAIDKETEQKAGTRAGDKLEVSMPLEDVGKDLSEPSTDFLTEDGPKSIGSDGMGCRRPSLSASTNGGDQTPKANTPPNNEDERWPSGLPWRPKVREKDIEGFLQNERQKYFGYKLPGDSQTIFGLPEPVHGSIEALRRNLYVSLSDQQLKAEERFNKFPFSQLEFIEENGVERLYRRLLPNMTEIVIALLKVILASLPSSKAKSDAVTVLSDVLTPETDTNEMLSNSINLDVSGPNHNVLERSVQVAIDINRHKELIIKAASSILITLLKFFRLNHIYQFENFAQYLVLANCIPLILKFLDQNICRYFQAKHELVPFNYPQCALYYVRNGSEWPRLNVDNVDNESCSDSPGYFLWRNVFSSIQLVRVLNKLTKGKHARTMMLVVFKSAPVLKRCMKVKLGIFQLYVLKLLKMQARYLGRQWRKSNMDIISAIYLRVRHRLNDDWAYANETRTKSFDFQMEEGELGLGIKKFNTRRYSQTISPELLASSVCVDEANSTQLSRSQQVDDEWDPKEFEPADNSLQAALAWEPKFSERFTRNYEKWLETEVYGRQTNWDALLANTRGILAEEWCH